MKKRDDDLKIDISEIFGENWQPPKTDGATTPAEPAPAAPRETTDDTQKITPKEAEQAFLEWREQRDKELEVKTLELERKLLEAQAAPPADEAPPAAAVEAETAPEISASPAEAISPVDFDAPIAAPFAGGESGALVPAETEPKKVMPIKQLQQEHEFLMLYDEFRNMLIFELKDLVGPRKTYAMLERSVEMTREKHPEIFRNANWDAAGNLLEGGSIDSQRIIDNKSGLDPGKADMIMDMALSGLLNLRFQAVEKGLGTGLKNKIRARMYHWVGEKIQKAVTENKDINNLQRLQSYL